MSSQDVTAIAASVAAAAAVAGVIIKVREKRVRTKALKFEEAGMWIIYVKPSGLLEECTVYLDNHQLATREKHPVKVIDVETGGKNFDIPPSIEATGKLVQVFSGGRRVYKKTFDDVKIRSR